MTVVSTKEFHTNQEKYLDIALNDKVIIQRGENMFIIQNFVTNKVPDVIFEPDEDFFRSITAEALLDGINEDIDEHFTTKSAI